MSPAPKVGTVNRHIILGLILLSGIASEGRAQTKGHISVGVSTTVNVTTDGDVGTGKGVGLLVRLNPKPGWGPAGAFNWFNAELSDPAAGGGDFARLRIRPLIGGVSYSTVRGALLTPTRFANVVLARADQRRTPLIHAPTHVERTSTR